MEYSNLFVCVMGMGIVFIGLIILVFLVLLMGGVIRKIDAGEKKKADSKEPEKITAAADGGRITPEIIAAMSSAIAENMGTNVSAIRIVSCKRI